MLIGIIRRGKGFVRFRITGKAPERLLNLAAQRGISLWDARPEEQGMAACTAAKNYKRIRPLARRAGVRTNILYKRGFPFFAAKYRSRAGLPAGAALGAILLIFLSQFIWTIDVEGTEHISETRLRQILAESGIHAGAYKRGADAGQAKRDALLAIDELSWLSVNISGCHARVEVKEKISKPELDDDPSPCNLKAKADGVITKITAGEGVAQVKVGSGVAKGDLLVSGVNTTKLNTVRYVRARGEVMADIISKKEIKLPKSYDFRIPTNQVAKRRRLSVLGAQLPCSLSFRRFDDAVFTSDASFLSYGGVALPLGVMTETERELRTVNVRPDKSRAEEVFSTALMLYEIFDRGDDIRISKQLSVSESKDCYICRANYVFNGNIAESVDFNVDEEYNSN